MRNYDDLEGGSGQQIYFRADRYDPKTLFGKTGPSTLIDGRSHRLLNLSVSGIAAIDQSSVFTTENVGDTVPVQMRIENAPLHEGHGRIVRVEQHSVGTKVALAFTDCYLDVDRIITQYKEHELKRSLSTPDDISGTPIPEGYRLLCSDALHLLRKQRAVLFDWERRNQSKRQDPAFGRELLDLATSQILPKWRELGDSASEFIDEFMLNPDLLTQAKQYTELLLTPDMLNGPIWHRSYTKPLGYPGDFEVMNYVYEGSDEGETLYGKLIHRLGLDDLHCVATRRDLIVDIVEREQASRQKPLTVTNLACGSAQDVVDLLAQDRLSQPTLFTLIDQDRNALAAAYENTIPHAIRNNGRVTIQCLHCGFADLMTGGQLAKDLPPQDLIYSVGLFDYLKAKRAKTLAETLYHRLAPGGLLVIGNLKLSRKSGRWAAELICDWPMIYRTERQMLDIVRDLEPEGIELVCDATDEVYLMCIRKPQSAETA